MDKTLLSQAEISYERVIFQTDNNKESFIEENSLTDDECSDTSSHCSFLSYYRSDAESSDEEAKIDLENEFSDNYSDTSSKQGEHFSGDIQGVLLNLNCIINLKFLKLQ